MKRFEYLHTINLVFYSLTLALYLTILLGMYAQVVLGAVQIILAFVLLAHWKKLYAKSQRLLNVYLFIVLVYGTYMAYFTPSFNDAISILLFFIIPMIIATYFVYVTHQIQQLQNKELQ